MSFDRRWFFTAAGSAFLASIAGILDAGGTSKKPPKTPKEPGPRKTGDPAFDANLIFADFTLAYGDLTEKEKKLCRDFLDATYLARWNFLYPNLSDKDVAVLGGMAGHLGALTKGALLNETKGLCGWKQDSNAVLREEHLQRAREMLGFHLNPHLLVPKRCGTGKPIRVKEPDEQCPLCPV